MLNCWRNNFVALLSVYRESYEEFLSWRNGWYPPSDGSNLQACAKGITCGRRRCSLSTALIQNLQECLNELQTLDSCEKMDPNKRIGGKRRPKYSIGRTQLLHFVECRFTVPQMAEMLKVFKRTVERQLRNEGISIESTFYNKVRNSCMKLCWPSNKIVPIVECAA